MKPANLNAFDRLISFFSPSSGVARAKHRAALAYFDGAGTGRRNTLRRKNADANTVSRKTLSALRNGVHDLIRNNPYAAGMLMTLSADLVGVGITPTFYNADGTKNKEINRLAKQYYNSIEMDRMGVQTLLGQQVLAVTSMLEGGEGLSRRVWDITAPLGYRVEVLESEFIDDNKDDGEKNIQGIEFKNGRRTAYHIYSQHPGGVAKTTTLRVPEKDVCHVYRQDRAGQVRGLTWFKSILMTLADYDDYEDAQLMRQKIAATFTAFLMGTAGDKEIELPETLEPGMILHTNHGQDVKFASPPGVDGYNDVASNNKAKLATGVGMSHAAATGDMRGYNFTSGRMADLPYKRKLDQWRQLTFMPQWCAKQAQWFLEGVSLKLNINIDGVYARHTPPRRELQDPTREIPALMRGMRGGLLTLPQHWRSMGQDPDDMLDEIEQFYSDLDDRGIILDTDPRRVTLGGGYQDTTDLSNQEKDEEDE